MTLIERAARAMADDLESHEENWEGYVHCVRAVLREIREPTVMMAVAGGNQARRTDILIGGGDIWRAMIDEALAEG